MRDSNAREIRREEYRAPDWLVPRTHLEFDLDDRATRVTARFTVARNHDGPARPLELDGVKINGRALDASEYRLGPAGLTLTGLADGDEIEIVNEIDPAGNTALEGLYKSGANFCTQCEAQGFRRITFFPDRPDVLSEFTTTLRGPADRLPTLLAGGNQQRDVLFGDGRKEVVWHDPKPKPA